MHRIALLALLVAAISTTIEAQRTVDWGGWTPVACYPGLDFRIGHTGPRLANGTYIAHVQFRNRYRSTIYFDYVLREPGAETPVDYRTLEGIPQGSLGPTTEFLGDFSPEFYVAIPPGEAGEVVVESVRMETDAGRYVAGQPGCDPATVSETTAPKPRLRNPIRARTEQTHDMSGSRIFMRNESEETLIVTAVYLYDCENIRNPCDVAIPMHERLDPGEEAQVLVVRPRDRSDGWTYRYRFTWDRVP